MATADRKRDADKEAARRAFVVDAEIRGGVATEREDVEDGEVAPQHDDEARENREGGRDERRRDVGEARREAREERVVFIRIHHANERSLNAREEGREHRADEEDVEHVAARLFKEHAVDEKPHEAHEREVDRELRDPGSAAKALVAPKTKATTV